MLVTILAFTVLITVAATLAVRHKLTSQDTSPLPRTASPSALVTITAMVPAAHLLGGGVCKGLTASLTTPTPMSPSSKL